MRSVRATLPSTRSARQTGQVLVIFAGSIVVLMGMLAIVVDISWFWVNSLRVQRAADAAALAGSVWLPSNASQAYTVARAEATKNGYTAGTKTTVTPVQDSVATSGGDPRQLDVTVTTKVDTFFMHVFGMPSIDVVRTGKAVYVQPVPMGSPLNYYGVYQNCATSGSTITCTAIPDAQVGGSLASQGFFGAIEGQGTNRSTGDAYATGYDSDPTANAQYDHNGYDYEVTVPSSGGKVYVWDPTFCATTSGPGGGHLGAGDHWLSTTNHSTAVPVSTWYRLWDTRGTTFTTADDTLVADSGSLFTSEFQVDKSPQYGDASAAGGELHNYSDGTEPALTGAGSAADCRAGAITNPALGGYWHNRWWELATGLNAGTYRLQITTTNPANPTANVNQAFENMWSLEVFAGGSPRIHGLGRMVSYANIQSGSQLFYLAQIDRAAGAGKTLEIDLFDPGDVGDKAWLQILDPDGNVYAPATFSFTTDANASAGHTSGSGLTCIQTYGASSGAAPPSGCTQNFTSGGTFFQNSWIKILISLPPSYGAGGLTPAGETSPGWWKIRYTVNKGNDTTTWLVSLRGNPVHLVTP